MLSSSSFKSLRRHSALLAGLDSSDDEPQPSATLVSDSYTQGSLSTVIKRRQIEQDDQASSNYTAPSTPPSSLSSFSSTSTTIVTESFSPTTSDASDSYTLSIAPSPLSPTVTLPTASSGLATYSSPMTEPGSSDPYVLPSFQENPSSLSPAPPASALPSTSSASFSSIPSPLSLPPVLNPMIPPPSSASSALDYGSVPQTPSTYPNVPQSPNSSPSSSSSSTNYTSTSSTTPVIVISVLIPIIVLCLALLCWRQWRARKGNLVSSSSQSTLVRSKSSSGKSVGSSFIQYEDTMYYEADGSSLRSPDSFYGAPSLPPGTVLGNASDNSSLVSGASGDRQSVISYSSEHPLL